MVSTEHPPKMKVGAIFNHIIGSTSSFNNRELNLR